MDYIVLRAAPQTQFLYFYGDAIDDRQTTLERSTLIDILGHDNR